MMNKSDLHQPKGPMFSNLKEMFNLQAEKQKIANAGKVALFAGATAFSVMTQPAEALTKSEINSLTYL